MEEENKSNCAESNDKKEKGDMDLDPPAQPTTDRLTLDLFKDLMEKANIDELESGEFVEMHKSLHLQRLTTRQAILKTTDDDFERMKIPIAIKRELKDWAKPAGWIRDLTLDGVEPNPGPIFWGHIVTRVNKLVGVDLSGPMAATLNQIQGYFGLSLTNPVLSDHVQKYFMDPNNSNHDLKDAILQAIKELTSEQNMQTSQGGVTREGIEPNSHPWKKFIEELEALDYDKSLIQTLEDKLKPTIEKVFNLQYGVLTNHVLHYLRDPKNKQDIEQMGLMDYLDGFLTVINTLQTPSPSLSVPNPQVLKSKARVATTESLYQRASKRPKIKENECPFLYGEQNFLEFGEGTFFRDNTPFIPQLESLNSKAIVSLHPRRFGKSLFVSILKGYYDIKNKDQLKELFSGYWIGDNITDKSASFLILPLDFSNLDVTSFSSFQQIFNIKNNTKLNNFIQKYKQELGDIPEYEKLSDFVSNFTHLYGTTSLLHLKMYVIIDEYDSSLLTVLSDQLFVDQMSAKNKPSKAQESKYIESHFKRFFSSLKEANKERVYVFVTGVSPLCLTEFTSGWNHSVRISDMETFVELYGLTPIDLVKGIEMIQPPIPQGVQEMLFEYCDCYDGYRFHPAQETRLFNPGRIIYFLQQVWSKWVSLRTSTQFETEEQLFDYLVSFKDDPQTRPAESTLMYITTSQVSELLLQDLLNSDDCTVECNSGVNPYFSLEKLKESRDDLISFMFYTGALTYAGHNLVKIPNPDARIEFVEAALRILEIDIGLYGEINKGIENMLQIEDIKLLCTAFAMGHGKERGVRDTIQGEVSFQEVCFNRLLVCRKPLDKVNSEYVVKRSERESNDQTKKNTMDIVYTDNKNHRRFCFELKNIRVQDLEIGMNYPQNLDKLKELSKSIAEMNDSKVLTLRLKPKNQCPEWFQEDWRQTVGEFMDNISTTQVIGKYKKPLQQDDQECGRSLAWVIVRVGLGKLIWKRAF